MKCCTRQISHYTVWKIQNLSVSGQKTRSVRSQLNEKWNTVEIEITCVHVARSQVLLWRLLLLTLGLDYETQIPKWQEGWSLQYLLHLELQPGSQSVTVQNCLWPHDHTVKLIVTQEIPSPEKIVAAVKVPSIYGRSSTIEQLYFLGNIAASSQLSPSQVHSNASLLLINQLVRQTSTWTTAN